MRLTLVLGSLLACGNLVAAQCTNIVDDFEALAAPGGGINPLPGILAIGSYNGVIYKPFSSADASPMTGNVVGINQASGTVVAAISVFGDLMQGGGVVTKPFGVITTTGGQTFTLQSFFFACAVGVVPGTPPAGMPQQCDIKVTGYGAGGAQAFTQTFSFNPDTPVTSDMALANISAANAAVDLSKVRIEVTTSLVNPASAILVVDDVVRCA